MFKYLQLQSKLAYFLEIICLIIFSYIFLAEESVKQFLLVVPLLILLFIFVTNIFDNHIYYNSSNSKVVQKVILTNLSFSVGTVFLLFLYLDSFKWNIYLYLWYLITIIIISISLHLFMFKYYLKLKSNRRTLILGKEYDVHKAVENFNHNPHSLYKVSKIAIDDFFNKLKWYENEIDIVYLVGQFKDEIANPIIEYALKKNKIVYLTTTVENTRILNSKIINISDESMIQITNYRIPREKMAVKRFVESFIALILLIIMAPTMILVAIAIKLESSGPVFYKQERVTLGNRVFTILKFRSMRVDAESLTGPVLAKKNDIRITKVGKFIRATRLDELPQLINVLRGDMGIVGPRPERPIFVEQFTKINSNYILRHNVRAGITGYAQVYGKYTSDFESKLKFDLLYIKNYSLFLDLKLLLKTILIIFDKFSSQGES